MAGHRSPQLHPTASLRKTVLPQIALVDALYRKSLRVSSAAKGEMGAGKIVNLQSNDAGETRVGGVGLDWGLIMWCVW